MRILALDACGGGVGVALWADGRVLDSRFEPMQRGHAERLPVMAADLLAAAGLTPADLDAFAATVGPGGFTGARAAAGFARGLALATGRRAVGVTSLEAYAQQAAAQEGEQIAALIDARRGRICAQIFQAQDGGAIALGEMFEADSADVAARLPDGAWLIGTGAPLIDPAAQADTLDPSAVASVAARMIAEGRPRAPSPVYLRAPDAKPQPGATAFATN